MSQYLRIGDTLLEMGKISKEQLDHCLSIQKKTSEKLGTVLLNLGIIDKSDLAQALAKEHHMEYCELDDLTIPPEVIKLVNEKQCRQYNLIPIKESSDSLTVALSDPLNLMALDNLRMVLGKKIQGVIADEESIQHAIDKYYRQQQNAPTSKSDSREPKTFSGTEKVDEKEIINMMKADGEVLTENEAPVIKLVSQVILGAFKRSASDIHFEPFEDRLRIRYRIDGILQEIKSVPQTLLGSIISRLKIMAKMDIAEKRLPQDGRIKLVIHGKDVDFRVSTLPSIYGESVVLRILDRSQLLLKLTDLGFDKREHEIYENLLDLPNGVILVTGPTGSGKTTTLYTSLNAINRPDRKIITVEDPIEYQISGINQVQVSPHIGLHFSTALKSILRQAPNIIMIGEIRDVETANIAIESSLTGHLVFSTLHTNDAPGAVVRLIDMGVKSYLVASAVQAVIAQRLVRQICSNCKEKIEPKREILQSLNIKESVSSGGSFYHGKGCKECSQTGYKGRVAIFELFLFNDVIRNLVYHNATHEEIREQARQAGMKTLREDGVTKALKGITTLEEVVRVTQSDAD